MDGMVIVQGEADLGEDRGPREVLGRNYNVKYDLAPDGSGLVGSPTLMRAEFAQRTTVLRTGPASLTLGGTVHDPLHELEILEQRDAVVRMVGRDLTFGPDQTNLSVAAARAARA